MHFQILKLKTLWTFQYSINSKINYWTNQYPNYWYDFLTYQNKITTKNISLHHFSCNCYEYQERICCRRMWTRSCEAVLGTAASSYEGGVGTDSDSGYYTPVTTARLWRLGRATWSSETLTHAASSTTHHTPDMSNMNQTRSDLYLCLRGKSKCVQSIKSWFWSWANLIVQRGANTPCFGWQQKYSILSTNPPWRPTGLNSSTPAHIPGWNEKEN